MALRVNRWRLRWGRVWAVWAVAVSIGLLATAPPALALVTVSHSPGPMYFVPGDTFEIDVHITWDGEGSLQGVFASTTFDDSIVQFVRADWLGFGETAASVFHVLPPPVLLPGLSRLGGLKQPGDPDSVVRTVSYGATAPANPAGAGRFFVTTLTFQVTGPGFTEIRGALAPGDVGAVGDELRFTPEPGTAVLTGLGLMALALRRTEGGR